MHMNMFRIALCFRYLCIFLQLYFSGQITYWRLYPVSGLTAFL